MPFVPDTVAIVYNTTGVASGVDTDATLRNASDPAMPVAVQCVTAVVKYISPPAGVNVMSPADVMVVVVIVGREILPLPSRCTNEFATADVPYVKVESNALAAVLVAKILN